MTSASLAWVSDVPFMEPEVSITKVTSRAGRGRANPAPPDTGGMSMSRP